MIPVLIIGVIVLMFAVIFVGGIVLGAQLSQMGEVRPSAGMQREWRRMDAREAETRRRSVSEHAHGA